MHPRHDRPCKHSDANTAILRSATQSLNALRSRGRAAGSVLVLGAMYLTKKQRKQGGTGTLLARPCERCGCGIRVKTPEQKKSWDAMGVSSHQRPSACDRLRAEREAEEAHATRDAIH